MGDVSAAINGLYFSHSESKYFTVTGIRKDQIESYAEPKGMTLEDTERWLASVLSYDV